MTKEYCKGCGYYEDGECCYFGDKAALVVDCQEHTEQKKGKTDNE
jgi:hypothetical protein